MLSSLVFLFISGWIMESVATIWQNFTLYIDPWPKPLQYYYKVWNLTGHVIALAHLSSVKYSTSKITLPPPSHDRMLLRQNTKHFSPLQHQASTSKSRALISHQAINATPQHSIKTCRKIETGTRYLVCMNDTVRDCFFNRMGYSWPFPGYFLQTESLFPLKRSQVVNFKICTEMDQVKNRCTNIPIFYLHISLPQTFQQLCSNLYQDSIAD